jgi:hypothetical protein
LGGGGCLFEESGAGGPSVTAERLGIGCGLTPAGFGLGQGLTSLMASAASRAA